MKKPSITFPLDEPAYLKYVVIISRYQGDFVFVRHHKRSTFEIPGGHIEDGESPLVAAKRELEEETGAIEARLYPVSVYGVQRHLDDPTSYGHLFFADIQSLGPLGEYEIAERILQKQLPSALTYPEIQPALFSRVLDYIKEHDL